jgi:hypothetical protein
MLEAIGVDVGAEVQDSNSDDEETKMLDPNDVGDGCPELKVLSDGPTVQEPEDTSSEDADSVGCAEP